MQNAGGTAIKNKWVTAASTCAGLTCGYTWADIGLANGSYGWRMQDYGAYGYGLWTAAQGFVLNIPYSVILGQPASTLPAWDNSFHWTGIPGATWYLIQVQNAGGTAIKNKWVTAASTCTGLNCNYTWADIALANGSYHWRIQDYGAYGYGLWSGIQDFTLNITYTVLLGQPSGAPLTSWDNSFHWTGIPGASWYLIQVQNAGGTAIKNKWVTAASTCTELDLQLHLGGHCPGERGLPVARAGLWRLRLWCLDRTQGFTLNIPYTVVLGGPSGALASWGNDFHWTGIPGASWYLIQVQNAGGTAIRNKWVTAASTCDANRACSYTWADIALADGVYQWRDPGLWRLWLRGLDWHAGL